MKGFARFLCRAQDLLYRARVSQPTLSWARGTSFFAALRGDFLGSKQTAWEAGEKKHVWWKTWSIKEGAWLLALDLVDHGLQRNYLLLSGVWVSQTTCFFTDPMKIGMNLSKKKTSNSFWGNPIIIKVSLISGRPCKDYFDYCGVSAGFELGWKASSLRSMWLELESQNERKFI